MKTWSAKISVSQNWIDDGFELKEELLKDAILENLLGYAQPGEVGVKVSVSEGTPIENLWLVGWELHVNEHTFHISQVIVAGNKEEALLKFDHLEPRLPAHGKNYHLQLKSMHGRLIDNLELLKEV